MGKSIVPAILWAQKTPEEIQRDVDQLWIDESADFQPELLQGLKPRERGVLWIGVDPGAGVSTTVLAHLDALGCLSIDGCLGPVDVAPSQLAKFWDKSVFDVEIKPLPKAQSKQELRWERRNSWSRHASQAAQKLRQSR